MTAIPRLGYGNPTTREIHRENLCTLSSKTQKRKALEEVGLLKTMHHSPDPNSVDFDKEGLLQEVNSMKEGEKVRIYKLLPEIKIVTAMH